MSEEVKVPDIGDFDEVPVIEIHVAAGDEVAKEDPLVTLESDKATMDVPSPKAGTVKELLVEIDDKVAEGTPILVLDPAEDTPPSEDSSASGPESSGSDEASSQAESEEEPSGDVGSDSDSGEAPPADASDEDSSAPELPDADKTCGVLVIGSGPGGYAAAFRAADLGLDVIMVERYEVIGGVCLNVGCIPSKALLHAARVIAEAADAKEFGLSFSEPEIDLDKLRDWKQDVVGTLTGGLTSLAKRRQVEIVTGTASLTDEHLAEVGGTTIAFRDCIIAAGSRAATLPGMPEDDERVIHSAAALELADIPDKLLVVGGGIIGLEMASVYSGLGSEVTVVEVTDQLIPGCDADLVKPLQKRLEVQGVTIALSTKVSAVESADAGISVSLEGSEDAQDFDRVLVAVGRRANGDRLELGATGVEVDERGEIAVDGQRRTNVAHIYAIGDIAGGPMLAHKATHEGKVAAEVIAGHDVAFEPRAIPSVAYTDPEVAWTGLTENEAKQQGIEFEKAVFPWQASGRALSLARGEGLTKLLLDPESRRVLGVGIVGVSAGDLIAEATLAIEMGADAEDLALTIHPHPTISETLAFSAEVAERTVTDLYAPKRKED